MAESCPEENIVPESENNENKERSEANKILCEESKNYEDRSKENKEYEGNNQELIAEENQEISKKSERNDEELPYNEEENQNLAKEDLTKEIPKGSHINFETFNINSANAAEDICSNTEVPETVKKNFPVKKSADDKDTVNSREDNSENSLPLQNEVNVDDEEKKQVKKQPTHLCPVKSVTLIDLTIDFPQPEAGPSGLKPRFKFTSFDDSDDESPPVSPGFTELITLSSDSETEENENSISLKRKYDDEEDDHDENQKKIHIVIDPDTKIMYTFPVLTEDSYPVIDVISDSEISDCEKSPQEEEQNSENEMELSNANVDPQHCNSNELSIETLNNSTEKLDESNIEEQSCEDPSQEENDTNEEKEIVGEIKELDDEDVNN